MVGRDIDYTAASLEIDATLNLRNGATEKQTYDLAHGDALQTDTTYAGGTATQWVYDTSGQASWSKYLYIAMGTVRVSQYVYLRNGGSEYLIWDQAHGDALQTDTTYNPDGSTSQWVYDSAGTNTWYKYQYFAAPGGAKESQSFYDRNGNIETLVWDPAHGDALQSDSLTTPTGAHQTVWDTAGTNGWSSYVADRNAAGQLTDQSYFERDGVSNTDFWTNGVLTQNVTIGAGGEKAEASYNSSGIATQVFDEEGRLVYNAWLTSSLGVSTPAGWTLLGATFYNTPNYGVTGFEDTNGDVEDRFVDASRQTTGLMDIYKDGTTNITLVSNAPGAGIDTLTSTFGSNGQLKDIVEVSTQNGVENFVAVTAAQLLQSMSTPGTMTFLEHGIEVLLESGTMDGLPDSRIFWMNVSSGTQAQVAGLHPDVSLSGTLHYAGAVVGAVTGGLVVGAIGTALAIKAATAVVETFPNMFGLAVAAGTVAEGMVTGVQNGVKYGWQQGGQAGDQASQALHDLLGSPPSVPPGMANMGGGSVNPDYNGPPVSQNLLTHS